MTVQPSRRTEYELRQRARAQDAEDRLVRLRLRVERLADHLSRSRDPNRRRIGADLRELLDADQ